MLFVNDEEQIIPLITPAVVPVEVAVRTLSAKVVLPIVFPVIVFTPPEVLIAVNDVEIVDVEPFTVAPPILLSLIHI